MNTFFALSHFKPAETSLDVFVIVLLVLAALCFLMALKDSINRNMSNKTMGFVFLCSILMTSGMVRHIAVTQKAEQKLSLTYMTYLSSLDERTLLEARDISKHKDIETFQFIQDELIRRKALEAEKTVQYTY